MFTTAMTVFAAYAVGFGVPAILAPDLVYSIFGGRFADEFARTVARDHAGLAVGLGLIAWLARHVQAADARRAIATGSAVANALVGVSVAFGTLNGAANALAWAIVASHGAFTVWLLYVLRTSRGGVAPEPSPA